MSGIAASQLCDLSNESSNSHRRIERDLLFAQHQCRREIIDFVRQSYRFSERHWDEGWGWDECGATDNDFAFPRIVDGAYVLLKGVEQPHFLGGWHNSSDYAKIPSGVGTKWTNRPHRYRHEPEFAEDAGMSAFAGVFKTDRVEIKCPGFKATPSEIASRLLHEAEHIILSNWWSEAKHKQLRGQDADRWYAHTRTDPSDPYAFTSKHSSYQVQAEFLCDIAEFPADWVTIGMRNLYGRTANSYLNNNILNPPGWRCSEPRPMPWPPDIKLPPTDAEPIRQGPDSEERSGFPDVSVARARRASETSWSPAGHE
jgi:hypothetical protein